MFDKLINSIENIGISSIARITDLWRGAKSDSLIDYTRTSRVEPIVLIDADCMYSDALPELQQSLLSIFAGYYLQAVAISTTVGKIDVMRHLDKLNPNRSPIDSAAQSAGWLLAQESYRYRLPAYGDPRIALEASDLGLNDPNIKGPGVGSPTSSTYTPKEARDNYENEVSLRIREAITKEETLELAKADSKQKQENWVRERVDKLAKAGFDRMDADKTARAISEKFIEDKKQYGEKKALDNAKFDLEKKGYKLRKKEFDAKMSASEFGVGKDTLSTIKDLSNLSVGKLFAVEITDGLHKASIPIAIRLIASSIPSVSLAHIITRDIEDKSAKERYHAWKSGRLEFIKDLVLCQDLIDAHRKNLMADSDNIYSNIIKRNRNNQIATIVSGNPSVATASNMVIMSNTTAAEIELKINGKLSNFSTREKLFKPTSMMIMVILDKDWDRCTFYHRGIAERTEVSLRDMKASNKGDGVNVSEVLKAYQMSSAPSL